jgi:hypothetical protein
LPHPKIQKKRERSRRSIDLELRIFGFGPISPMNRPARRIGHWMWRLDILQDPKLSVRAAPSLAKSDLLMISLHGERRLSARIRKLVDEQLVQTVNYGSALLALFEGAASATRSPLYACLSTLAEERGLDFFEQTINEGEDQANPSLKLVWVF